MADGEIRRLAEKRMFDPVTIQVRAETLTIDTTVTQIGRSSVTFAHVIRERTSQRVVVEGSAKLVTVDLQGKVKRLGKSLVDALQSPPRGKG